ncbi:TPA: methylenetetrahydrofolate reductase [Providencia stuartii]|nr:methylenetetrahydrofolate reductase [Providencia stuartii]HAT8007618.1 methylenetetrahydrofolate reductase [Providencia stuartii]
MLESEGMYMETALSFEISAMSKIDNTLEHLLKNTEELTPLFYTVNTEIGKTEWRDTYNTCCELKNLTHVNVVPHIAINNKDECELCFIIEEYLKNDITELFVIRGDRHRFDEELPFNYGIELIDFIRRRYPEVMIKSSIYPDYHKESITPEIEIDWLRKKLQLGVTELISQLCLNKNAFSYMKKQLGNDIPITISMMPMLNFSFIESFFKNNAIDYPLWIKKHIRPSNINNHRAFGIQLTQFLIGEYIKENKRLHFFTLNNAQMVKKLFDKLR